MRPPDAYYRALTKARIRANRHGRDVSTASYSTLRRLGRRNLAWLAATHGTDKRAHAHNYVAAYATHIGDRRHAPIALLEIGILRGASLRMWRDYFPRARIVGLDLDPPPIELPGVELVAGDQSDAAVLTTVASRGPFDVVIDDGSHIGAHIEASFRALFPAVEPGGWYVIEDMQTAYRTDYGGGPPDHPGTSVAQVKAMVDAVNREWVGEAADGLPAIRSLHVYDKIAFIEKA